MTNGDFGTHLDKVKTSDRIKQRKLTMQLPTLYARTSNGATQQWTIEVTGNTYRTHEGLKDGKITTSMPTVCDSKNVGRANETTPEDQALSEAKSKWQKKLDSGYYEDISKIDIEKFVSPMLAKKYDDEFDPSMFPVYSERKYDGQRCVATKNSLTSRNGKPILSVPHILEKLKPFFDKHPNAILDGELYTHSFCDNFNRIISLVKKTKPSKDDLIESSKFIQYHVYDYISMKNDNFSKRYEALQSELAECDNKVICIVEAVICKTQDELNNEYNKYMELGYEGQMIRLDKPYEQKRSKFLLKRKEFDDTEFELIDIFEGEGNRSGMAGYATIKHEDGRIFKSPINGNQEWLKELLVNAKDIRGKMVTIRHFKRTPDGIPRFPKVTSIRDYE